MIRRPIITWVTLFIAFAFNLRTSAHLYIVTDANDTTNAASLRGAILEANRQGGQNTIILGTNSWIYPLTIPGDNETTGLTGDLNITRGELTIKAMITNVTIDATGLGDRVFKVSKNARLTLENLIITGGTAPVSSNIQDNGESGGAIYNAGTLLLESCVVSNNTSGSGQYPKQYPDGNAGGTAGGDGGGIYNNGMFRAYNCTIVGNASGGGTDGASGGNGGGIRNDGDCLLQNCIVSGNEAGSGGNPAGNANGSGGNGGNGGGIFNSGTMILEQCIVGEDAAGQGVDGSASEGLLILPSGGPGGSGGNGGGIYNLGQLEIDFSTIYGNNTGNGGNGAGSIAGGHAGSGGSGGGIFNAGRLIFNTSTISSNSCGNGGNGGYGSYVSGGSGGAGGSGGGIDNTSSNELWGLSAGTLDLTSSTITLNVCGTGGNGGNGSVYLGSSPANGGSGGSGGGILNVLGRNAVSMRNSLIAQNLANAGGAPGTNSAAQPQIGNPGTDGTGFDLAGNFKSHGFNLIGTGDGSTGFIARAKADHVGTDANPIDPLLGPLQMNGGFTPTHALLWGSPAIDQGNCFGIHRDQRGNYRPYIYPSHSRPPGGDGSDIGAFELDVRVN